MKMNLYHPKTGELRRIHHHDVEGWIADGWLTSPPDLSPIVEGEPEAIAPKKKAKATTLAVPVDPE